METLSFWKTATAGACLVAVTLGAVLVKISVDRKYPVRTADLISNAGGTYVSIKEYDKVYFSRAACQRDVSACQNELARASSVSTNGTSTREYVLDGGLSLVRQTALGNGQGGSTNTFWLRPLGASSLVAPSAQLRIGDIPIVSYEDGEDPVTVRRLDTGTYELHATEDTMDALKDTFVWIRPETQNYLLVAQSQYLRSSLIRVKNPLMEGELTVQVNRETCNIQNFEPAQVESILWNNEPIYRPSKPLIVPCSNAYDSGLPTAFNRIASPNGTMANVLYSADLKSFSIGLADGKTLAVSMATGTKPVVTVK